MNRKKVLMGVLFIALLCSGGCQYQSSQENPSDGVETELNYETIYSFKTPYIGDAVKTAGLIRSLHYSGFMENGIEMKTSETPYQVMVTYVVDNPEEYMMTQDKMLENAAIVFSLIDNADVLIMNFTDHNEVYMHSFERSHIKEYIGIELTFFGRDYYSFSNGLIPVLKEQPWEEA